MITIDRIDDHTADITIDQLTIVNVPINTWHEGAGPGWRSYTAVEVDWTALLKIDGIPQNTISALSDAESDLSEPLQIAYAEHQLDDRG